MLSLSEGSDEEKLRLAAETEFFLVADQPVTEAMIATAVHLQHVQHQGVGYDSVDTVALAPRGITLGLTPEGTSTGVAEHTILLMLAVSKQLPHAGAL